MLQYLVVYLTECCYAINYVLSSFISPIEVVVATQLKLALTTIKWSPKAALSGWNTLIKLSIGL